MCTREFFKQLEERWEKEGHIVLLDSMGGHRVVPISSVHFYSATKFAITAITEGLRQELREKKSNVRVTVSLSLP